MAEITLTPMRPLSGLDITDGDTRLRETPLEMVSAAIPLGAEDAVAEALSDLGLDMPSPTLATAAEGYHALRLSPDQVMLLLWKADIDAALALVERLEGTAHATLQSDAWVALEISGAASRAALERICPLDLHDDAFPDGAFGRTVMEHMSAVILRRAPSRYLLLSASSSAKSFAHAVEQSMRYTA